MSVIAQANSQTGEAHIDRLQAEIKALSDVEQLLEEPPCRRPKARARPLVVAEESTSETKTARQPAAERRRYRRADDSLLGRTEN